MECPFSMDDTANLYLLFFLLVKAEPHYLGMGQESAYLAGPQRTLIHFTQWKRSMPYAAPSW